MKFTAKQGILRTAPRSTDPPSHLDGDSRRVIARHPSIIRLRAVPFALLRGPVVVGLAAESAQTQGAIRHHLKQDVAAVVQAGPLNHRNESAIVNAGDVLVLIPTGVPPKHRKHPVLSGVRVQKLTKRTEFAGFWSAAKHPGRVSQYLSPRDGQGASGGSLQDGDGFPEAGFGRVALETDDGFSGIARGKAINAKPGEREPAIAKVGSSKSTG